MSKRRLLILLSLLVITPIGFLTKFYSGPAEAWVSDSLGGLFYEIFWCLVFSFIISRAKPLPVAAAVFIATSLLEILQLWHPPFLEMLRSGFIGRTILGNSFNPSDFIYYVLGCVAGYFWLKVIENLSKAPN